MKSLFSYFAILLGLLNSQAQNPIFLVNPSFEDFPGYGRVPREWQNCTTAPESPPDTHPIINGDYGVSQKPFDGQTYIGMVTRENGTTELVSQRLKHDLAPGKCYTFSIYICHSSRFQSATRTSAVPQSFTQPVVLKVWGGESSCAKRELLAVSPAIQNTSWVKYDFQLNAKERLEYLTLEADYLPETKVAYNGNLLLDNASPIVPVDCTTAAPLVNMDSMVIPVYEIPLELHADGKRSETLFSQDNRQFSPFNQFSDPKILPVYINSHCGRLGFLAGTAKLPPSSKHYLMELAHNIGQFSDQHLSLAIPDQGEKLNKKRARKIRNALLEAGLPTQQFSIKRVALDADMTGWQCGALELWLKVETLK